MNILKIDKLSKSFNGKTVIDNLNLTVKKHTIYGFIGNNGTGKTTTMKTILGLLKADSGEIEVCGQKVAFGNTNTNSCIGYLPDVPEFYGYMKAEEYLKLCAEITNISKEERLPRIKELLELVGLDKEASKIKTYSRGMKQRLGIAQALINKPQLLICDEPTSALDPQGRSEILNILKRITVETTVIFSTHILSDVERICDTAGILHKGNVVKEINLHESLGDKGIMMELSAEELKVLGDELELTPVSESKYRVENQPLQNIYKVLQDKGVYPESIVREKRSLEDVYMEVTS